jgi:hypothetical protein
MSNETKQTAVEWQFEQLFNSFEKFNNKEYTFDEFLSSNLKIREQAKAMHELEIIQFMGHMLYKINGNALLTEDIEWCKQKYNETYGGNK